MGNVDKRIENLERLCSQAAYEDSEDLERRRAAFAAKFRRAEEKALREAAEGNPTSLHHLEELAAYIRSKRENKP
jgi:hypothetical protein